MKRHVISALIIGLIVGGLIVGLHVTGWLLRPELVLTDLLSGDGTARRLLPAVQYGIVFAAAIGAAFLTLASSQRGRMSLILAILLVELGGVAWVCSLYKVFFQPLPGMAAVILGYGAAFA